MFDYVVVFFIHRKKQDLLIIYKYCEKNIAFGFEFGF